MKCSKHACADQGNSRGKRGSHGRGDPTGTTRRWVRGTVGTAVVSALAGLAVPGSAAAQAVWSGFDFSFSKSNFADWTLPGNQDRITGNVWLTRADTQGVFNIAVESFYSFESPADTRWATQLTSGGQTIAATNWANLTFTNWAASYGGPGNLATNITAFPAVVHLVTDDIYLDLQFTSWGIQFDGGGFAYDRAVGVVGPKNLVWDPTGAGGNNWSTDPANSNWLDGLTASSFTDGDIVNFTDSGVGVVMIDAGGVAPGATNVSNSSGTYTFTGGALGGDGALSKSGGGALVMENVSTYTGGTDVSDGMLTFAARIPSGAVSITGGTLTVAAKATPNDPSGTSVITSLSITGSTLDLTNNSMVIEYETGAGPNPALATEVREHLLAGRMISSEEDGGRRLGYGDNAVLGLASFGGVAVPADSMLIKYTFGGDATLDGVVNISDLSILAGNWQQTERHWFQGDFNYDGVVNISDLSILAGNWQAGASGGSAMSFEEALAMFDVFDGVVVPEPVGVWGVGLALGAWSLKRLRRRG